MNPHSPTSSASFANWLAGLEVRSPERYDKGYWDKANGFHKDSELVHDIDYKNGWKQAKFDTKEIAYLASRH